MTTARADLEYWDRHHVWHAFTQMQEYESLLIERGEGCWLVDSDDNRYLDGSASMWCNVHGHRHPRLDAALAEQAAKVAHTTNLGLSNPTTVEFARRLCELTPPGLDRVFFSDDGSTAVECALRLAWQYWEWVGQPHRRTLIAFSGAYHGDTLGAASLGGIPVFAGTAGRLGLPVRHIEDVDALDALRPEEKRTVAAIIIEPLVQGAAGIRLWPAGLLRRLRAWCDAHDTLLIFDEVMTGFGRTGRLFAGDHEAVTPDFLCLAKGLTGGYSPLAATLTTRRVFQAFLGPATERRTFFYGHSYSGHPLGCAAALASLRLFRDHQVLEQLAPKIRHLATALQHLRQRHPSLIRDVRQCGFIAGIEITPPTGHDPARRWGADICLAARPLGLLTRPIHNTLILMPPLCTSIQELDFALAALESAITRVLTPDATPGGFQLQPLPPEAL